MRQFGTSAVYSFKSDPSAASGPAVSAASEAAVDIDAFVVDLAADIADLLDNSEDDIDLDDTVCKPM